MVNAKDRCILAPLELASLGVFRESQPAKAELEGICCRPGNGEQLHLSTCP
jgi:hypothetical protein